MPDLGGVLDALNKSYWPLALLVGAAAGGLVTFFVNLQTVRNNITIKKKLEYELEKLKLEVAKLRSEDKKSSSAIVLPTAKEILDYGVGIERLFPYKTRELSTIPAFFMLIVAGLIVTIQYSKNDYEKLAKGFSDEESRSAKLQSENEKMNDELKKVHDGLEELDNIHAQSCQGELSPALHSMCEQSQTIIGQLLGKSPSALAEHVERSSMWLGGGFSQAGFCAAQLESVKSEYPGKKVALTKTSEDSRKSMLGHVEYQYHCEFTVSN